MIKYMTSLEAIGTHQLQGFFVGWSKPWSPEQLYQILENSAYIFLAYDTEQSKVVGLINALSDKVSFAFIPMLEVLPEYQNMGIGGKLMENMVKKLEHIECVDLTCDVEMQGFYEKFGMLESHGMVFRKYLNKSK